MTPAEEDEAGQILALVGGNALRAFELLERQLSVLVLRTQVLLSLSGIVITVTGFSGRAIAATSATARACISSGILVGLAAAAVAFVGVLRLRWLTQELDADVRRTIERGLAIRDKKSRHLTFAIVLFVIGLGLYCAAIAQLLIATPTAPSLRGQRASGVRIDDSASARSATENGFARKPRTPRSRMRCASSLSACPVTSNTRTPGSSARSAR